MEQIMTVHINKLEQKEAIPYELLLLADPYRAAIERYLGASEIYVATLQDAIVGVYVLYAEDEYTVEIKNIAVDEKLQGRGIGKQLLAHASVMAKDKGYTNMIIGTGNSSIGQLALYQKQGFEIFDIKKNFFLENYIEPIFEDGIQCRHMIMLVKKTGDLFIASNPAVHI